MKRGRHFVAKNRLERRKRKEVRTRRRVSPWGLVPRSCVSSDSKVGPFQGLVGVLSLRLFRKHERSLGAAWAWRGSTGREASMSAVC